MIEEFKDSFITIYTGKVVKLHEGYIPTISEHCTILNNINRWGGNINDWSVLHHSLLTASIAMFAIENDILDGFKEITDIQKKDFVKIAAIHDFSEILFGDIPTKYKPQIIKDAEHIYLNRIIDNFGIKVFNNWKRELDAIDHLSAIIETKVVLPSTFRNIYDTNEEDEEMYNSLIETVSLIKGLSLVEKINSIEYIINGKV